MSSLSWEQVRQRRLVRNHLLARAPRWKLVDVIRDVCGVQAQVAAAAELAIAARVEGLTQAEVRAELWEQRTLLKSWSIRGTLHLHASADLPLWAAAVRAADPEWYERYGLDAAQGAGVLDAIAEALDGRCLLRSELAAEVDRRVGTWAGEKVGSGWGYLLGQAALAGKLCHGPPQGTKSTFVRPDQWDGAWVEVDPGEAQAEACRRYLAAYGPSTPRAFSDWLGLKVDDARRVFDSLGLEEVDVEGGREWRLADSDDRVQNVSSVRLLPEYDCYVMGFREREQLFPPAMREVLQRHPRGRFEGIAAVPTVLVAGRVAGLWRRSKRGQSVEIVVEPLWALTSAERTLLEEEAERVGAFLAASVTLRLGSLSG